MYDAGRAIDHLNRYPLSVPHSKQCESKMSGSKLNKRVAVHGAKITLFEHRLVFVALMLLAVFICMIAAFGLEVATAKDATLQAVAFNFLKALFYTAAASLTVVLIVDGILAERNMKFLNLYIGESFDNSLARSGIQVHGIKAVHDGLPHALLKEHMRQTKEMLFLQTYVADMVQIESALKAFFDAGGAARVLLLDPRSDLVDIRSREIRHTPPEQFRLGILSNIDAFRSFGGKNVEIRLHQAIPSVSIYGDLEKLFVGNYLHGHHAVQGPILEVSNGLYFDKMLEHFNNIWDNSVLLDHNAYSNLLSDIDECRRKSRDASLEK